jgi:putative ABC transport system substrate-binding protein
MRRRQFITLLGGAAAVWPLAARAQQPERMRRVGVLTNIAPDDPQSVARLAAFTQSLRQLGWTDQLNVRIDFRWGAGDVQRVRRYATELVDLAPDVILAHGGTTVGPLQQATRTVPIVFVATVDPVGQGFVASLSRPGRNATGFLNIESGTAVKWLELLKQISPQLTRAAVIRDPAAPGQMAQFGAIQGFASSVGVELYPVDSRQRGDIESAIAEFARDRTAG